MLSKITTNIEQAGINKIINKSFMRNNQQINTTSAYIGDKLYYRKWDINQLGNRKIITQTYNAGEPIPKSLSKLDIKA